MKEKTYFLDMFSDYEPPESLKDAISQAAIVAADMDLLSRSISMNIYSSVYIPQGDLQRVRTEVCSLYDLKNLELLIIWL